MKKYGVEDDLLKKEALDQVDLDDEYLDSQFPPKEVVVNFVIAEPEKSNEDPKS